MSNPPPCPPCGRFEIDASVTSSTANISETKQKIHKAVRDALAGVGHDPEVTVEYSGE